MAALSFVRGLWRGFYQRLKWVWLADLHEEDYRQNPLYVKAVEKARTFDPSERPKGGAVDPPYSFGWVRDYAKARYEQLSKTFDRLDEKADSIVRYLGGGTALFTLAALGTLNHTNAWLVPLLLPSICFALTAVYYATKSRRPRGVPMPPYVERAIEYAKGYGDKAEDTFLPQWHATCEGLKIVLDHKQKAVTKATISYYRALVLLLLPLIVGSAWWIFHAPQPAKADVGAPPTKVEVSVPNPDVKITSSP